MFGEIVCDIFWWVCYLFFFDSGDLKIVCIFIYLDLFKCLWSNYLKEYCMYSESKYVLYDYVVIRENIYNMGRKIKKIIYFCDFNCEK